MKKLKFVLFPIVLLFVVVFTGTIIRATTPTVDVVLTSVFDETNILSQGSVSKTYGSTFSFDTNVLNGLPEGTTFAYWVVNGSVRPELLINHQFTITNQLELVAVFSPANKHTVLFMDSNGKLLKTAFVNNGETISDSGIMIPSKPGFEVKTGLDKWNGSLTNITKDEVFILQYNKVTTATYALSVSGGSGAGTYNYNDVVTVNAEVPGGKYFSHWKEGTHIVSYNQSYKFSMLTARSIEAVFVDSPVTATPVVSMSNNLQIRDWYRSYLCQFLIPEGYTYVEHGIITSMNSGVINFDTGDVVRRLSNKFFGETNEFVMSIPIGSHKSARAYLVVKQGDTILTYFSDNIPYSVEMMPSNGAQEPSGSGTQELPYLISNASELYWISQNSASWNKYFEQTSHIDLSMTKYWYEGAGWLPIGVDISNSFTGSYDGKGYIIDGLTVNRPNTGNVGLFGHVGNSTATTTIKNLGLTNVEVRGARGAGSLIGRVTGQVNTVVSYCYADGGIVVGDGATGGLVGTFNSYMETPSRAQAAHFPRLIYSYANINVSYSGKVDAGKDKFGGLAGCGQKGTIENSYAMGSVTADGCDRVGGLAGCIDLEGKVENVYSTGQVSGSNATQIGGLVGRLGSGVPSLYNFWDTQTSGQATSAVGDGKTTSEMKTQGTYTGWNFTTIWNISSSINNGYPYLR